MVANFGQAYYHLDVAATWVHQLFRRSQVFDGQLSAFRGK